MPPAVRAFALLLLCCSRSLSAQISDQENQDERLISEDGDSILTPLKPYHVIHECINMTSLDGVFYIKSPGRQKTCGVYLSSAVNTIIEIELEYLNVPCHTGGLIALVDGWEMNGQLFPSPLDHRRPVRERFLEYCGTSAPRRRFYSSQNAALLQYRLPIPGSAVSIHVRHLPNPAPCNQLMMEVSGVFTLRNAGQRKNCTFLSMIPVDYEVLPFHVGVPEAGILRKVRAGPFRKCDKRGWRDYVEVGEAVGLDTSLTVVTSRLCGRSLATGPRRHTCSEMFVARLVSSGLFDNNVEIRVRALTAEEFVERCPVQYDDIRFDEIPTDYDW